MYNSIQILFLMLMAVSYVSVGISIFLFFRELVKLISKKSFNEFNCAVAMWFMISPVVIMVSSIIIVNVVPHWVTFINNFIINGIHAN